MKTILLTLVLALGAQAFAKQTNVSCDVQTLKDAQKCMERVALKMQDYEEPNDGFASAKKETLLGLLADWNDSQRSLDKVAAAGFVGAVLVHGDEHHLVYFAINKGRGISPVEIYDFNIVDLEYMVEGGKLKPSQASAKIENYFLGGSGDEFDMKSDLQDTIKELLSK